MSQVITRTPARDRVRPFIPRALAEGWSASKLAREADVSRGVATDALKAASATSEQALDAKLSGEVSRAVTVARQVRDAQIAQAGRIEALTERALADLEQKAEAGALSIRDLETLSRLREKHWQHVKDMAGINAAEKIAVAKAKGEATGKGIGESIAAGLIDSTAIDIGDGVYQIASADIESAD